MKNSTRPALARGFTALELIIVLVIGFSIIAMSASKMGDLFSASKATQAINSILDLATALRELKGPSGYDSADPLIKQLKEAEILPKSVITTGPADAPTLKGVWEKPISLMYEAATSSIKITYEGIPKAPCNKILRNLLANSTFKSIEGSGGNLLTPGATSAQIIAACTPADNAGSIDLIFEQQ